MQGPRPAIDPRHETALTRSGRCRGGFGCGSALRAQLPDAAPGLAAEDQPPKHGRRTDIEVVVETGCLSRGEEAGDDVAVVVHDLGMLGDLHPAAGERAATHDRVGVEIRLVQWPGPVGLRRDEPLGADAVEPADVIGPGRSGSRIVGAYGAFEGARRHADSRGEIGDRRTPDRVDVRVDSRPHVRNVQQSLVDRCACA